MKKSLLALAGIMITGSAFAAGEIITEQPEGTLRTFHGYSHAYYVSSWGYTAHEDHDGFARQVVFADNGVDVYFKDPFSKMTKNVWIKGTLNDGIITVETPQLLEVTEKDGVETEWFAQRLKPETYTDDWGDVRTKWLVDEENTFITYKYENDCIVQTEENVMLGLVADGEHQFYGDVNVVYTAVNEQAAQLPEELAEDWTMRYKTTYAQKIQVAIDNNDVFIRGFWPDQPAACIKGKIEGDKMILPTAQYVGFMQDAYYTYFMVTLVDRYSSWIPQYITVAENLEFAFDKENMAFTPLFDEDIVPVIRYGKTIDILSANTLITLDNMSMKQQSEIGAPEDPTFQFSEGCFGLYPDYNWGYIRFNIPNLDVNGNALDTDNLYYSIYLDEELLVIDPEDANYPEQYKDVETPMTEIPFNFDNKNGITTSASMSGRYLQFFHLDFDEIGVQSIYKNPDTGTESRSRIAYLNAETKEVRYVEIETGIGNVAADNAEIATVSVYDLLGNKVSASHKGIVIEVIRYTDGTTKSTKKVSR